jgi:hypothetical protein
MHVKYRGGSKLFIHPALLELSEKLINNSDRYKAHREVKPIIESLCNNRIFLHEAVKGFLMDPNALWGANSLSIPLLQSGDVLVQLNIFCPIRDGAKLICHDNIHHHGWRLLSTGVVTGEGYEAINFVHGTHNNRDGTAVNLEIDEIIHHRPGEVRFLDSNTAHVVFHTKSLCATLAVWSADKIMVSQGFKRHLEKIPSLKRWVVKAIHALRLNNVLGLNPLRGLYYHPENGKIVETQNYNKPFDGNREEILGCWFKFFQNIELDDKTFWKEVSKNTPPEAIPLIEMLTTGVPIPDHGIWGNLRRRFSKTQILQALDNSTPADVI